MDGGETGRNFTPFFVSLLDSARGLALGTTRLGVWGIQQHSVLRENDDSSNHGKKSYDVKLWFLDLFLKEELGFKDEGKM